MMEPHREPIQSADLGANIPGSEQQSGDESLVRRRTRTLRNLLVASLLVCVALIGVSSFLVTGTAGALRNSLGVWPGIDPQTHAQQNVSGVTQHDAGPSITQCDCQSSQVSLVSNSISGVGREILVNLTQQHLYAYQDGQVVRDYEIASGRPELPTPVGRWSVMYKVTNITFTSPWPEGSPYYYYPTHINYALLFHDGGYYLHDAWWRHSFGPGSNVYHQNPDGSWETGSHGCVGMTIDNAKWLYDWAPVGATVLITR